VDTCIESFAAPHTSFSIYTFADPGDPAVVAIITITAELFLAKPSEVEPYQILFDRLRAHTLPESDSLSLIIEATAMLPDGIADTYKEDRSS
jgi:hypothetical protein